MLDSIYHMTLKIHLHLKLHAWCENDKILSSYVQRYNGRN